MINATTRENIKGELRINNLGKTYKVIEFSRDCFINHYTTWLVEYVETGKRFYRTEKDILNDKKLTKAYK